MTTLTHSHSPSPSPSHSHSHGAAGATLEVLPDPSPVAAVVLDIGDGFGAVVIDTPPWLEGREIEIRKVGTEWRGVHTAVRARLIPTGTQFAAVFGSLAEGRYDLRVRAGLDECPVLSLDVTGASVTYSSWP
jgi:hypothetical protein